MKVDTRYNAGTQVFFIDDAGRIADSTIRSVKVEQQMVDGALEARTTYQLTAWRPNGRSRINKTEEELFPSLQDLLEHLTNDYKERSNNHKTEDQ